MNRAYRRALKQNRQRRFGPQQLLRCGAAGAFLATGGIIADVGAAQGATTTTPGLLGLPPLATLLPVPKIVSTTVTNAITQAQDALNIPAAVKDVQTALGGSYAGYWIDNSGPNPVIHFAVASTASSSEIAAARTGLPSGAKSSTTIDTSKKYTLAQLTGFMNTLTTYAQQNFETPGMKPTSMFLFALDPVDNAVEITLAHADANLLAPLQALVPSDALRITWNTSQASFLGGPGNITGQNDLTYPPYKAGLTIFSAKYTLSKGYTGTGHYCTSGFTMLGSQGTYWAVTAGHCATASGWKTRIGSTTIGTDGPVRRETAGGDYTEIKLNNPTPNTKPPQGRILADWNSKSGFVDDVVGYNPDTTQGIGLHVCYAGVTSNAVNCGYLIRPARTTGFGPGGVYLGRLACANIQAQQGDSGGPWYVPEPNNAGNAAGVTSFGATGSTCYTTITAVITGTGHFVRTQSN